MARSLRAARVATFVYFVLCGALMGTWVVHIPAIEERVGISHATLGGLLVLLGLGAVLGMQVTGRLTDRLGTRVVVPASGVLCGAALVLPGLSDSPWMLAGALLVFGFCNGCLDVSMNAHAVHVEKAYQRPVMSAFHATFSVGGVLAALVAAGAAGTGLSTAVTLGAVGALGIVVALIAARGLLPGTRAAGEDTAPAAKRRGKPRQIWILAGLALMVMLCEGAANDWSALHLKDVLGVPASVAAFGYGTFAAAMTVGRLLADRVSARFGSMAALRYGSATAAVGITIVALTPWTGGAFAGWALFGLGLSGCVPQLFSAAGHADPAAAGANVSRVAGLGYLGMLAGPAVIGWLTHLTALNHTFLLLSLLCVTTAAAAGVLRVRDADHPREPVRSSR
ncbi:MFS transporter [Nonomuraea endophytica]|uniref:MFS family permease n=1 Tax=Nonomuraea endophytica TaxID=714136 RepID=A0A7W8EM95_9ACTN|nr:MFS transporter [Nonomuraea endophytica]MBB5084774.1 MFS family permease [Nonomuraea endophytica]